MGVLKVKVISLPYIFQVLYVLCFTRPRYHVSVYRTIGPLVYSIPSQYTIHLLNRDYISQKDSRPTVGRSSADLSADKMPDFSSFFIGRQKINYNYLVIIFFLSADSFGVLAIGR